LAGTASKEVLAELPLAVFDPSSSSLRDAWGTPLSSSLPEPRHRMAPRNAPFFVSAGPDRKFLTRADNLYSYDAFRRPE